MLLGRSFLGEQPQGIKVAVESAIKRQYGLAEGNCVVGVGSQVSDGGVD